MTREEAFKIMKRPVGGEWEYDWIRRFVELGMLKLDEPPSLIDKINRAMCDSGYAFLRGDDFKECMEKHGLKIVEASPLPRPNGETP